MKARYGYEMLIISIIFELLTSGLYVKSHQLPDVDKRKLDAFIGTAMIEQTDQVPTALLVSLAWAESRFEPSAKPACGVLQVFPRYINRPQSDCRRWQRDVRAGVHAGVAEIEMMLIDRRVAGSMRRALMYRACGNAFFAGTCSKEKTHWVQAAIARWRWLAKPPIKLTDPSDM